MIAAGPIDVHAHVLLPETRELARQYQRYWAEPFFAFSSEESNELNSRHFGEIEPKLTQTDERLADMDRMGIAVQALSILPPQYYYWADPALGEDLAQRQNDFIAGLVAERPDRFIGLATVPLQDVERATRELGRCVTTLGFRGVEISSNVNGVDLDDPRFEPFFAMVEELDVCIVLHPLGFTHAQRLREHYLTNIIGQPLETTIALTRLILCGLFERRPRLRVCAVHGGGYLPFYSSRLDHAFAARREVGPTLSARPSEYLKRVYVDSLVYDSHHLEVLVATQGADRVVIGTDYPADMGFDQPVEHVLGAAALREEQRERILSRNARELLGITP